MYFLSYFVELVSLCEFYKFHKAETECKGNTFILIVQTF